MISCVLASLGFFPILQMVLSINQIITFRCDKGRGGGVCIDVKDVLSAVVIDLKIPRQTGNEDRRVTVQCRKLPALAIGCMYWHPKGPAATFNYIQDILRIACMRNKALFILGDFNDNVFASDKFSKTIENKKKITPFINKSMRVTATT